MSSSRPDAAARRDAPVPKSDQPRTIGGIRDAWSRSRGPRELLVHDDAHRLRRHVGHRPRAWSAAIRPARSGRDVAEYDGCLRVPGADDTVDDPEPEHGCTPDPSRAIVFSMPGEHSLRPSRHPFRLSLTYFQFALSTLGPRRTSAVTEQSTAVSDRTMTGSGRTARPAPPRASSASCSRVMSTSCGRTTYPATSGATRSRSASSGSVSRRARGHPPSSRRRASSACSRPTRTEASARQPWHRCGSPYVRLRACSGSPPVPQQRPSAATTSTPRPPARVGTLFGVSSLMTALGGLVAGVVIVRKRAWTGLGAWTGARLGRDDARARDPGQHQRRHGPAHRRRWSSGA